MSRNALQVIAAYLCGALFGIGLTVSQMVNPAKVLAFLDIFGKWDPSLALVMGGALVVAAAGYRIVLKTDHPFLADRFQLPTQRDIDLRLIGGSTLFGVGWGLTGLCPGPAVAVLSTGMPEALVAMGAMLAGMIAFEVVGKPSARTSPA